MCRVTVNPLSVACKLGAWPLWLAGCLCCRLWMVRTGAVDCKCAPRAGVTGREFRVLCIRKLAKSAWPVTTATAIRLATVVRELPLTAEQAVAVLQRLTNPLLAALDTEALPPYIYQLILFSGGGGGGGGGAAAGAGSSAATGASGLQLTDRRRLRAHVLRAVLDHCDSIDIEIGGWLGGWVGGCGCEFGCRWSCRCSCGLFSHAWRGWDSRIAFTVGAENQIDGESMELSQSRASQYRGTQSSNPNVRAGLVVIKRQRSDFIVFAVTPLLLQASVRILRAVEGTILLHINAAAKHDPLIISELVRWNLRMEWALHIDCVTMLCRGVWCHKTWLSYGGRVLRVGIVQMAMFSHSLQALSPFRIGVLLAVARIPRCEATVMDLLRKRMARYAKYLFESQTSPWLQHQVRQPPLLFVSMEASAAHSRARQLQYACRLTVGSPILLFAGICCALCR